MSKNPYQTYEMDADKEKKGVIIVENEHFRIKGARAGGRNQKYEDRRDAITKPYKRMIQTNTLGKEVQERLNAQLASEALVTEWAVNENAGTDQDPKWATNMIHNPETGEVVEYTSELGAATFVRYPELYQQFAIGCSDVENYLDKEGMEEDVKN